uniref:hypothetical protein n=1 Tax=Neobacillus dielmonensis TaxID=1347369 RepID=UPI0005AA4AA1
MPQTVIADAGYGSEENYVYTVGDEKEQRFDFLIPYGTYLHNERGNTKKIQRSADFLCRASTKYTTSSEWLWPITA